MALQVRAEPAPLRTDRDGMIRVGDTRVTLATIVWRFIEAQLPKPSFTSIHR